MNLNADWLFAIGKGEGLPPIDGLVGVDGYDSRGRRPEEVVAVEKAANYGARAVFFEAGHNGRAPLAQAFVFTHTDHDDLEFAALHKRLWSWGGVPLVYRSAPGQVQLFRCAHQPDFIGPNETPICKPIRTINLAAKLAEHERAWWDARRIRSGALWDDTEACGLLLSAKKSAHRTLFEEIQQLTKRLNAQHLLDQGLQRRLLIFALLIAYLEERDILFASDFERALAGASSFFQVLRDGRALIRLLDSLEERFNGNVFRLEEKERVALEEGRGLHEYARFVEGIADSKGQLSLWRRYSFRDLPVELICNIYQLFVNDKHSSIYSPPALVRLILEEALSFERIDALLAGDGVILDPACGSGVFLVEAFQRLVLYWRAHNGWRQPKMGDLRALLQRVHGIDVDEGAVELAAFSLCLSLCDTLEPEEIRASIPVFPQLVGNTLHHSCFFEARERGLLQAPVAVVVGNPPFQSKLTTGGAQRMYARQNGTLPDKQVAYLFLHEAMELLEDGGLLAMIQPSGFLYNKNVHELRQTFFRNWTVREVLDFVSVRGLFKRGGADTKIIVVLAEAKKPSTDARLLHAVFRRNGLASAELSFDIDFYDLHWFRNAVAIESPFIWRANLLGGSRVHDFIARLSSYSTLGAFAQKMGWDFGEGYIAGRKRKCRPSAHLVGRSLLPTDALSSAGLDTSVLEVVPDIPIENPRAERRFSPPLLLIKEHEDLHHGLWTDHYLTYMQQIVGFSSPPNDTSLLASVNSWLLDEATVLRAFVAGISNRLFTQRATALACADIFAIPYPEDEDLDLSENERIVAHDIVNYQREFIRLGAESALMKHTHPHALDSFDEVFVRQIGSVYARTAFRPLPAQKWPGAICKPYVFGKGEVDWSGADDLWDKLDALLREHRGSSLTITRITRLYDEGFVFLLKPDIHRFWTQSIALRDADDVLADLRAQGF
jgi:hypothetical protein